MAIIRSLNRLRLTAFLACLLLSGMTAVRAGSSIAPCSESSVIESLSRASSAVSLASSVYSPCYPRYLTLDPETGMLFWFDEGKNRIFRSNTDGSDFRTIAEAERVQSIAVDSENGKLYWMSGDKVGVVQVTRFFRANLDGSFGEEIRVDANRSLRDLVIDPSAGRMYWYGASPNNNYLVHTANLDGTDARIFQTVDIRYRAFDVERGSGTVFWISGGSLMRGFGDDSEVLFHMPEPELNFITMEVSGSRIVGLIYNERDHTENLYTINLDGTGLELTYSMRSYADISVDAANNVIYWAHVGGHRIFSSDMRGENQNILFDALSPIPEPVNCSNGSADRYACKEIDLIGYLSTDALGIGRGSVLSDIWGWTDPVTSREYALIGHLDGVSIVDVTVPQNPFLVGVLPRTSGSEPSNFRDIKVYQNHMYVVSEAFGHGMQIFDLRNIRDVTQSAVVFEQYEVYSGFSTAHNLAINEQTGFAYLMGARGEQAVLDAGCNVGGLHMYSLQDPEKPEFVGCFIDRRTGIFANGYTHDAQCVVYDGPDASFRGREICVSANETHLSIADVTDKTDSYSVGIGSYANRGYAHQGWLTEDHRFFLMNDEKDESRGLVKGTRTIIWDLSDLSNPYVAHEYISERGSSDHNLFVVGDFVFQSNYEGGLQILDISDVLNPVEIGSFDTFPCSDGPGFAGSWSNYPFFPSGTIAVVDQDQGLFLLQSWYAAENRSPERPQQFWLSANYPNPFNPETTIQYRIYESAPVRLRIYDTQGRLIETLVDDSNHRIGVYNVPFRASGLGSGVFFYTLEVNGNTQSRPMALIR